MAGLFMKGQNTVTEAERVSEFQINQATYGNVVPIIFGTTRIAGNIIDYFNFTAIQHSETTRTGKGGGGTSSTNITYTYKAAVLIGLCEGQITSVGRVWQGADTITTLAGLGFTLFNGALGQAAWSYAQSVFPAHALPYSGLAYVAGYIDLNSSGGMYTYNFEVAGTLQAGGDGVDCNPADICNYIMTNAVNGIGITGINAAALANFHAFADAADLLGSLPLTDQSKAYEIVNNLCEACDVMVFDSQGELKFVPRCEETIGAYVPDLTVQYDLDEDDFLPFDNGVLVQFSRTSQAATYNQATVEYINRANGYESETVDKQVLADVSTRGLRPASTKTYHFFHTKARAEQVAMRLALKSCYDRLTYTFRLAWNFCRLEPGDIVTLSLSTGPLLLNRVPVRIETVEEDDEGELEITAKPLLSGVATPARYTVFDSDRASRDCNVDPGNATAPMLFQIPATLTENIQKVMMATAGGPNWGGCKLWVSDDGNTYKQIGEMNGKSRYGNLISDNGTSVVVVMLGGTLDSGTAADAQTARTLCYVNEELFSYETATLTGANQYTLSGLVRGQFGTIQTTHSIGAQFARIDMDRLFGYGYLAGDIGKTIYVKMPSFNVFGAGVQELSEVTAHRYVIKNVAPPDVSSVYVEHLANGRKRIQWGYDYPVPNDVVGFRIKLQAGSIPYWDNANNVFDGIVSASPWETDAIRNGSYIALIKAVDASGNESASAAYAVFNIGDELVENVLIETDIKANGFAGTKTGCSVVDGNLVADDSGRFWPQDLNAPFWPDPDALFWTSQYVAMTYIETLTGQAAGQLLIQSTITGNGCIYYGVPPKFWPVDLTQHFWPDDPDALFWPQDDAITWVPYTGKVNINLPEFAIKVEIAAGAVVNMGGRIERLTVIVDVPDIEESFNDLAISAGGTRIPLTKAYDVIKNVGMTLQDTGTGALTVRTVDKNPTLGPLVKAYNAAGTAVSAVIDGTIQGYKEGQ